MAAASLGPHKEQTPEPLPLQTGGKRSGLAPSTCRAWDHNVPNGNAFHFAPQKALLSVGTVTGLSLLLSSTGMPLTLP